MENYGRAYIRGKWRTIISPPRQIKRGKNKGHYEVKVNELSQPHGKAWTFVPRAKIVCEAALSVRGV